MIRAIITAYHPSASAGLNAEAIAKQVDEVIVCDNSPQSNAALFEKVHYVWFGENRGLSGAFNAVLKDPNIPWRDENMVIFFDQDSSVQEGHIANLVAEFKRIKGIGCLGPVYFNTSSGLVERPKSRTPVTKDSYAVAGLITSSMLTTYGNLRKVGFWNEEVFLDMADWELCWRMNAIGLPCCMTEVTTLNHSVGSGEKKIGPIRLRVGSAFREYYQIRDGLYLLGKRYTPLKFKLRILLMLFLRSPLHILFLDQKRARARYIARGIGDFFRGVRGELKQGEGK